MTTEVEKRRVRGKFAAAVRRGDIKPPSRCEHCGRKVAECGKLEGHHTLYDPPVFKWLCKRCHRKADRRARRRD